MSQGSDNTIPDKVYVTDSNIDGPGSHHHGTYYMQGNSGGRFQFPLRDLLSLIAIIGAIMAAWMNISSRLSAVETRMERLGQVETRLWEIEKALITRLPEPPLQRAIP